MSDEKDQRIIDRYSLYELQRHDRRWSHHQLCLATKKQQLLLLVHYIPRSRPVPTVACSACSGRHRHRHRARLVSFACTASRVTTMEDNDDITTTMFA